MARGEGLIVALNPISGLIPRGSLGLKLLLVCLLVLIMGIPLLVVGASVADREGRAREVTAQIGAAAGGAQVVGGPMLLVPYQRTVDYTDNEGRSRRRVDRGSYVVFAETGTAATTLTVNDRRVGIYRAAIYDAVTDFDASFTPAEAMRGLDPSYRFDWGQARIVMFVSDSRAIRNAAELRFADGSTAMLEPISDLSITTAPPSSEYVRPGIFSSPEVPLPTNLQAFAAPAPLAAAPADFTVESRLQLTGAERFSIAAFAQDTAATIRGNRRDARAEGAFQSEESLEATNEGFVASCLVPFLARGIEKAADLNNLNIGAAASRDMAITFVSSDNIYQGVARAVRYGIMFIGIVFLATLVFEAVSGRKAHPAQYILVGLAQCVFYLLLLSMTEIIGFTSAFLIAAVATIVLLAFYAAESFRSVQVGWRALLGLGLLYGAMYVLLTLEDFALFAGAWLTF